MFDVAVVGSVNLDLVAGAPRLPGPGETVLGHSFDEYPGGKGLNQAVTAARHGAAVAFVGAVGDDQAGERLRLVAAGEGIDVERLAVTAGAVTGRALITVGDDAQNSIVVIPGANASVSGRDLPDARAVLAQLEIPLAAVRRAFTAARAAGALTILNPAPATPLPDDLLDATEILVPNEHEVALLGGAESLLARGVGVVVVTEGAAGVTVHEPGSTWRSPAIAVSAVDTTGAGDAFCGALAAQLAAGQPLRAAVRRAIAAGAHAVTVAGAVPSLPTAEQSQALLARS